VKALEWPLLERTIGHRDTLPRPVTRALVSALLVAERALPSAPEIEDVLRLLAPDAVFVSPLVTGGSPQTDYVKSARALGIPSGVLVASWDNLTNKGLIRVLPDRVFVWNEAQRTEAAALHRVPPERVVVTGAQPFDRWFGREPTASREAFCARVGLDASKPYVCFVGSTSNIADAGAEDRFVRRWMEALRASGDTAIRDAGILVRPHPDRRAEWSTVDCSGLGNAVVWPPERPNSVVPAARGEYFDSLHHSAAIVGINTSAMVEGAIIDRPVLTIRLPEFEQAQEGTLHFDHLLPENGGPLFVTPSFDAHAEQLAGLLADPAPASARNRAFVGSFIRPNGIDRPANPRLVEAVEALAAMQAGPVERGAVWLRPLLLAVSASARRRAVEPDPQADVARLRERTRPVEATLRRTAQRAQRVPPAARLLRFAARRVRLFEQGRIAARKRRAGRDKERRAERQARRFHRLKRRPKA
jgi:hypothetical protein